MAPKYTDSEWMIKKPRIADLYVTQGLTATQVHQDLKENGFDVGLVKLA